MVYIRRTTKWLKQLNLFKSINHQMPSAVAQQRLITRIYLVLLASMVSRTYETFIVILQQKFLLRDLALE